MPEYVRQGQTRREAVAQSLRTLEEVAGLPNNQERDQGWNHQEWEPSRALTSALQELPLLAQTSRNEDLANLKPHLEEALQTLERLEQRKVFQIGRRCEEGRSGCC